jgi:hypothetical protein
VAPGYGAGKRRAVVRHRNALSVPSYSARATTRGCAGARADCQRRARRGDCAQAFRRSVTMIRKLSSGQYRLYSRKVDPRTGKHRNLGTFDTLEKAQQHERAVQYFKRRG